MFASIGGQDFCDRDAIEMMLALGWFEFCGDVRRERLVSSFAVTFASACASKDRSVSNEPDAFFWVQVESWSFCGTRHVNFISIIASGVTKCLFPILKMVRLPRRASARNESGEIAPPKKRSQASRLTCRECLDRICQRLFEIGLDDDGQPLPWNDRPECEARNRSGQPCRLKVVPGKKRCRLHGGLSTGPKTQAGKAKIADAQRRRWAERNSSGR